MVLASTNVLVALGLSRSVRVAGRSGQGVVQARCPSRATCRSRRVLKVPTVRVLIVIMQVSTFALTTVGAAQVLLLESGCRRRSG